MPIRLFYFAPASVMKNYREIAKTIFLHALQAVEPGLLVRNTISANGKTLHIAAHTIPLTERTRIYVIGIGKASVPMAQAVEEVL